MRYEATATCLSWIPPTAVEGVFSLPFGLGVAHFDQPPPDQLPEIEALLSADAIRFANQLHAWIEVQNGQIIAHGMSGGGHLGSTTVRLRSRGLTFAGGLGETDPVGVDLRRRDQVGEGDAGEGQPVGPQPDRGGTEVSTAGHPVRDDLAVLDLDPRVQLVGEPDRVGGQQCLDFLQLIGRRLVEVGHAQAEWQAEHSLDRGGRDPRQARRGGFVSHQALRTKNPASRPGLASTGRGRW